MKTLVKIDFSAPSTTFEKKYLVCSGNAALNESAEYPNATGRRSQDVPFHGCSVVDGRRGFKK